MTTAANETRDMPRLKQRYREEILPALKSEFEIANVMQVPGLTKIVVNMGVGEAARDSKLIEGAVRGYTRCQRCGRPKAVYRKFGLCRICLREMAHRGELPGVTKSSW